MTHGEQESDNLGEENAPEPNGPGSSSRPSGRGSGGTRRRRRDGLPNRRSRWLGRGSEISPRWSCSPPPVGLLYAGETAAAEPLAVSPMASLLTRHQLRHGEVILLVLKPSVWFVLLSSLRWIGATLIVAMGAHLWLSHITSRACVDFAVFSIAARILFACSAWIGRLYVLTDQRVLQISGVFHIQIFECPLRKSARTRLLRTTRERLLRLGSLEIIPQEESRPCVLWQTIRRPREINERVQAAIQKAKIC